jgi:hypothetical protein
MTRLWWLRTLNLLRRNKRQAAVVAILGAGCLAMVVLAWWSTADRGSFWPELWINVGIGLAITLATYLVLNPLFKDLQTASIVEHARLDPGALVETIGRGRERVAILETWTGLLEEPYRDRFVASLRTALSNQAVVRILLLDPDSEGARLRGKELRGRDVPLAIMSNLYRLARLHAELNDDMRSRLRVRVYDASPSVQMYRCDNRAFIAFFPIDQSTYDAQQIETLMNTPIGEFVQGRFDELWSAPTTADLATVTAIRLRVHHDGSDLGPCQVRYVRLDGTHYVSGSSLLKLITRYPIGGLRARVDDGRALPGLFSLDEADEMEASAFRRVVDLFQAKYGPQMRPHAGEHPVIITLVPDIA